MQREQKDILEELRGTKIRVAANFFSEITQSRQEWNIAFKIQGKWKSLSKNEGEMKT